MNSAVSVNSEDHILWDLDHLLDLVFIFLGAKLGKGNCVNQDNIPRREPEIDKRDISLVIFVPKSPGQVPFDFIVHTCNHSQGISSKETDLVALMVNHDNVLANSFHCHTLVSLPADLCRSLLLSLIKFHYLSLQILKVSLSVLPHRCCITWN